MINTADGALIEVSNMLQRMRELAIQASNGTATSSDRDYMNSEYQNLVAEIERIADNTQWNGTNILNQATVASQTFKFQVGANGGQTIGVVFGAFDHSGTKGAASAFAAFAPGAGAASISAATNASAVTTSSGVLTNIDTAMGLLNDQRATFGAAVNQLSHAIDNLSNVKVNAEASRSRIKDANYAEETSELARTQIIQQAGTAMLAQANQVTATVLMLLR